MEEDLLGPEVRKEYLDDCRGVLREAGRDLEGLKASGSGGEEAVRLKKFAHRIKGSGGTYGYHDVSDLAGKLEDAMASLIASGQPPDAPFLRRIDGFLEAIRSSLGL